VYQNVYQKRFWQIMALCLMAQLLFFTGISSAEDSFFKDLIGQFGVGLSMTHNLGDRDRIDSAEVVNNVVRVSKEHNDIARVMLETHFFYVPKDCSFLRVIDAGEWGWGPFVGIETGENKLIQAVGGGFMLGFLRKDKSLRELRCEVKAKEACKSDSECESLKRQKCEVDSIADCEPEAIKVCQDMDIPKEEKTLCRAEAKAKCKAGGETKAKVKDSFNIGIGVVVDPSAKVLGDGITENQPLLAGETQVRFKETSQKGIFIMVSYSF